VKDMSEHAAQVVEVERQTQDAVDGRSLVSGTTDTLLADENDRHTQAPAAFHRRIQVGTPPDDR
jgi:hypothetical protein